MLGRRIATALVLLLLLGGALAIGPAAFLPLCAVLLAAAAVEWFRLAGMGRAASAALALALVAVVAAAWSAAAPTGADWQIALLGAALLTWCGIAALLVRAERRGVRLGGPAVTVAGVLLLGAAAVALLRLYSAGLPWLLSAMALVWLADIAAYFAGRAFGRRKLAPQISPGKTWAGVGGAVLAVVAVAATIFALSPQAPLLGNALLGGRAPALGLLVLVALTLLSVVGDLFESLLKRQAGVKDSSKLLPGHGGVLDRIDAQLPILPAAALLHWWLQ